VYYLMPVTASGRRACPSVADLRMPHVMARGKMEFGTWGMERRTRARWVRYCGTVRRRLCGMPTLAHVVKAGNGSNPRGGATSSPLFEAGPTR